MTNVTQTTELVKVRSTTLIVVDEPHADGVHYVASIDEWVTVIDGEVTSYHSHQGLAWASYNEQLATCADHIARNEYNAPGLFVAGPITWEVCPDCGQVNDVGTECAYCVSKAEQLERFRNNVVTRHALEVGDSEPWPGEEDDDIPFDGRPMNGQSWGGYAAEYGLQPEF
jgi:hypothetical protein